MISLVEWETRLVKRPIALISKFLFANFLRLSPVNQWLQSDRMTLIGQRGNTNPGLIASNAVGERCHGIALTSVAGLRRGDPFCRSGCPQPDSPV